MQTMILTNTLVKKYGKVQTQKLMNENSVDKLMGELDRSNYCEEIINVLEGYIEEVNLDKLLLYSAYRYMEELEIDGLEGNDVKEELKTKLEIMLGNIQKNAQIRKDWMI